MQITLNLLAPEKKAALRTGFMLTYAQTIVFIVFIVVAIISATLVSLELVLRNTETDLKQQTSSSTEQYDSITSQIAQINKYLDRIDKIQGQFTDWSAVLEDVAGAAPAGARFDAIHVGKDKSISVQGTAPTRQDVLTMQNRYEAMPFITGVTAPLSNILEKVNPRYEFSMKFVGSTYAADAPLPPTPPASPSSAK